MVMVGSTVDTQALVERLRTAGLRCTQPRLQVLKVLVEAASPRTHAELSEVLGALDRATVFRNLVALTDAGLVRRLDLGDHVWRYELSEDGHADEAGHAHFTCVSCGDVVCLDGVEIRVAQVAPSLPALAEIEIQLRGRCRDCD